MKRVFPWFLLAVAAVAMLAGCASNKSDVDPNGDTVSSTPWNKPASWESSGALGGALGH